MEELAPIERGSITPATGAGESSERAPCCSSCSAAQGEAGKTSFVYVVGQIEVRIPRLSVEKELAQATGRADTSGSTDRQALHRVLARKENRYLARQMCWVLTVQGLETYLVMPRDPADLDALIAAIEPRKDKPLSTVIGVRGPLAPPDYCNGLVVPILLFDQIYTFSRQDLIEAIPRPDNISADDFEMTAGELFDRLIQMIDNAGESARDRALNYLSVRYPAIYAKTGDQFAADFALTAVEVRPSPVSGTREIVEVIFSFTNRATDFTEKHFTRVDVTEEFPFLVTKLSPYYDR